ncbi:MAG: replicative DNA helicase [Rickettsiales bacterium]|jgi:replicative DNA helicase|nr:replicative DNA helicase [Rickettsiales bacterium]
MQKNFKPRDLYNIEAEQIVLGRIISNNDYYLRIAEYLQEDYFYDLAHREIYRYIAKIIQKSSIIADSVTLKSFFDTNEILLSAGGSGYLSVLLGVSSGIVDIVSYAKLIEDLAIRRKLAIIGENIVNTLYSGDDDKNGDAREQIELAETKLFELSNKIDYSRGFLSITGALSETVRNTTLARQRENHLSGISSGFIDLDRILSGFQKSDLVILAGRPSMGKTTLAINIAYNAALEFMGEFEKTGNKKSVGIFSLEMPANQISAKILSIETGLDTDKFRKGDINEGEFAKIVAKSDLIAKAPLFIDDTPALTISSIRTRIRRLVKQENAAFIVIDYLQLIHGVNESSRNNRVQEISEITQGLKAIAKEFNLPLLALSQLSRLVEQREDKKPQLSDLRESGSIEQDADIVMFVFRESYYEERKMPNSANVEKMREWQANMDKLRNKSEIIIAKHRNGPIGKIELYYNAESSKFADYIGYYNS